jgi:hypothetical protein
MAGFIPGGDGSAGSSDDDFVSGELVVGVGG